MVPHSSTLAYRIERSRAEATLVTIPTETVMRNPVTTTEPMATGQVAARLMWERKIGCFPVTDTMHSSIRGGPEGAQATRVGDDTAPGRKPRARGPAS